MGLGLALRALWFRRGVSAVILAIATVAVAAAALGPIWSTAAQESLLRDRLANEPVGATGLAATRGNQSARNTRAALPAQLLIDVTSGALEDPALDTRFGPVRPTLRLTSDLPVLGESNVGAVAFARLAWKQGQCELLRFTTGRCPEAVGEVALSARAARSQDLGLGPLRVQLIGGPAVQTPVVTGLYEPIDPADPAWFSVDYFDAGPRPGDIAPPKIDTVFASRATFDEISVFGLSAIAERPLLPDAVRLEGADRLRADVTALIRREGALGREVATALPELLDAVRGEQDDVSTGALVVAAQLLLRAAAVLQLVLAGATEARAGEVALARLRGAGPWRTAATGLLEPLLLLVIATPLGLLLALGAGQLLVGRALRDGTTVSLTPMVGGAAAVALAAGAVAAVIAGRRVLTAPVLTVLRKEGGRPSGARGAAVEAVVVALAAAGTYQLLDQGGEGGLALLTPALLALAVGLVGVRLVPLLALALVRRTRHSSRIASFLAVRQVARRSQLLRVVVLLSVAVALAVFAVDGWKVAGDNRQQRASLEVGAATVLHLGPVGVPQLMAAVRAADPEGTQAMAAVESVPGGQSAYDRFVAVDSERLAAVGAWSPTWTGRSPAEEAARLRPAGLDPITVNGGRIEIDIEAALTVSEEPARVAVEVRAGAVDTVVALGVLTTGSVTYAGALPVGCAETCTIRRFVLDRSSSGRVAGEVLITEVRVDGVKAEVPLTEVGAWRGTRVELYDAAVVIQPRPTPGPQGLRVAFDSKNSPAPIAWTTTDVPGELPVLVAPGVRLDPYGGDVDRTLGIAPDGTLLLLTVASRAEALPRAGRGGALADLVVVDRLARLTSPTGMPQVWLAPGADVAAVRASLAEDGLQVLSVQSRAERRGQLDQEGPALALLLFLVAAAAALVLSIVAVSAVLHDAGRSRAAELSALRILGVGRRALVRACLREQLALLGVGLLLGTVAGAVAVQVALPRLPVAAEASGQAPAVLDPALELLGALLGATAVVVVVVAVVSARLIVRAAGLGRRA